ncbi:hypothetical protein FVR03_05710 [Pontibacter qinzhouensis]|uniref:Uncharacterized protein n=1 Tax=Pontibacter qinzhouensis TaxID=2603253 RepID=A0A5C8KBE0_9BACT|nr:hypothetical protein [Pontibacter qinzhouensis]TXK49818.1 hypothetical protein FVR03_05710 [Pontibacter qinzhouensis]
MELHKPTVDFGKVLSQLLPGSERQEYGNADEKKNKAQPNYSNQKSLQKGKGGNMFKGLTLESETLDGLLEDKSETKNKEKKGKMRELAFGICKLFLKRQLPYLHMILLPKAPNKRQHSHEFNKIQLSQTGYQPLTNTFESRLELNSTNQKLAPAACASATLYLPIRAP